MKAIIVGPDRDLGRALAAEGFDVERIEGPATGTALAEAGVEGADLLVITDVGEATAVSIAKDVNPDLQVLLYSPETMPEFARGQVDLAVAPDLLSPDVVAEELAGS